MLKTKEGKIASETCLMSVSYCVIIVAVSELVVWKSMVQLSFSAWPVLETAH